jgi:hypothetical protein
MILRKVCVIAISSFGASMDAEIQTLLLIMVLILCSALQHAGQPYDTSATHLLPNLEMAVLFMLIMTLWSGLMMFKLNDSGNDSGTESSKSVHVSLTMITVVANVLFVIALIGILLRQLIQESREKGSSLVIKLDQLCGCGGNGNGNVNGSAGTNNMTEQNEDVAMDIELSAMTAAAAVPVNENPMNAKKKKQDAVVGGKSDTANNSVSKKPRKTELIQQHATTDTEVITEVTETNENEVQIIIDESTGKRYSYNKSTGETKWVHE